jgi:hypothetical protein
MNLNQEFHEHLQAGRLTEAISLVVGQLVELKITTKANSGRLHTTVDLLNGQITNTVDPAFFSDKSSQKLLEFHTNQITATAQVVREQLRSLQDLLQAMTPPAAASENIKLIAITSDESGVGSEAIEPVNVLAAAAPTIISTQTSETLPVALTEAVSVIKTISVTEKSDEILAPDQPISQPEPQVAKAPENLSQPEIPVTNAPDYSPISQPETLEPLSAKIPEHLSIIYPEPQVANIVDLSQPQATKATESLQIFEPAADSDINTANLEPLSAETAKKPVIISEASWHENRSERVKLPETLPIAKPASRAGIASGLAAALAQTSALDPSEAGAIPNKFDQALRSAGVRSNTEEAFHPFAANKPVTEPTINQPVIEQPTELIPKRELIDLLRESEDDWDEWLLEEDNILSELSDVTKDKVPDLESHWLSAATNGSVSANSSPSDWEEFMPEYPEVSTVANRNQANVERFRQNLVNDPQLMSELLAELDDLEEMEQGKPRL